GWFSRKPCRSPPGPAWGSLCWAASSSSWGSPEPRAANPAAALPRILADAVRSPGTPARVPRHPSRIPPGPKSYASNALGPFVGRRPGIGTTVALLPPAPPRRCCAPVELANAYSHTDSGDDHETMGRSGPDRLAAGWLGGAAVPGGDARRHRAAGRRAGPGGAEPGVGAAGRLPHLLHAGRLRPGGNGPDAGQERRPHDGHERDDLRPGGARLLGGRLRGDVRRLRHAGPARRYRGAQPRVYRPPVRPRLRPVRLRRLLPGRPAPRRRAADAVHF